MIPPAGYTPPSKGKSRPGGSFWAIAEALIPPALGGVFALLTANFVTSTASMTAIIRELLPVLVSIVAVVGGFQTTAHSVILSLRESPAADRLRARGIWNRFVYFHAEATALIAIFLISAVIILFLNSYNNKLDHFPSLVASIIALFFVWSSCSTARNSLLVFAMLLEPKTHPE